MHSLCLLDGLGHGEEDAVDADGEHDDVVEVLGRNSIDICNSRLELGRKLRQGFRDAFSGCGLRQGIRCRLRPSLIVY